MVEHQACHDAITHEREIPARFRKLTTRDVASLGQPRLRELEGGENEKVRVLVEPRLAQANLVHDAFSKRQLRQCYSSMKG
jgi:hypothetical protein